MENGLAVGDGFCSTPLGLVLVLTVSVGFQPTAIHGLTPVGGWEL